MRQHTYETCLCEGCKNYRKEKELPEPVSAYDTEVRRIAEILHNKYWEADGCGIPGFDLCQADPELFNQARAMVAEVARQVERFAISSPLCPKWDNVDLQKELIERGLIPSPKN